MDTPGDPQHRQHRTLRAVTVPVVLLLLLSLTYWNLTFSGDDYIWFDQYDMCHLEVPRLQFWARNLHQGNFPLWNPHSWAGQPTLGVGQPGPLYPLNLFFLAWPLQQGALRIATLNWWFVALHFVSACSMYLFCRDQNLSRAAGILGALAFSSSGYFGSLPWLDIANGASLTPLVFLFAIRLWTGREGRQSAAWLGLALGVSWLSGHHEIPLLNSYAVSLGSLCVFGVRALKQRRYDFPVLAWSFAALALAVAVSSIQTLPLYEFGHQAKRWAGVPEPLTWDQPVPYEVHAQYSLPWSGALGLLIPDVTPESHTTAFLGLAVITLAAIGLRLGWVHAWLKIVTLLGSAGFLYALGAHTPFHRLLYLVLPMLDKARTPVRGLYLLTFALTAVAAYGAHCLLERRLASRTVVSVALALLGLIAVAVFVGYPADTPSQVPFLIQCAIAAALLPALSLWNPPSRFGRPLAASLLVLMVLVETRQVTQRRVTAFNTSDSACATDLFRYEQFARDLRAIRDLGRITVDTNDVQTAIGDLYGLDQLQTFTAAAPANILRHELHTERTQQLFGVTHHLGRTRAMETDIQSPGRPDEIRVFEKAETIPRAWIVHETLQVTGDSELRQKIQDPGVDLAATALFMEDDPPLEQCPGAEPVQVERPDSDTVVLIATLNCRGIMVLSDTHYPGWNTVVDGEQARIYEVNGSFRGVLLEAGRHTVRMSYEPDVVRWGVRGTLGGLLAVCLLAFGPRRKHKSTDSTG